MKTTHIFVIFSLSLGANSQGETSQQTNNDTLLQNTSVFGKTYIPNALEVPAFVPPPPPVEKKVPVMRVDATITVPAGNSHTLTIRRGEASTLPDIPALVVVASRPPRQLSAAEIARYAEERRRRLNFNAEVYDNGVSIIRWQHPDTAERYEAICGFDVNLLAGVGQFTSAGNIFQLSFIPPGVRPTTRHRLSKQPIAAPPQALRGTVTFTRGNPDDPIGTATAILLRDLIANEESRLITYQQERFIYQKASADWQGAHPILPRDESVWLRPHRGSRYLTKLTP